MLQIALDLFDPIYSVMVSAHRAEKKQQHDGFLFKKTTNDAIYHEIIYASEFFRGYARRRFEINQRNLAMVIGSVRPGVLNGSNSFLAMFRYKTRKRSLRFGGSTNVGHM